MLTRHKNLAIFSQNEFGNNSYIIIDENANGIIIDPSNYASQINDFLEKNKIKLICILITHIHYDHIASVNNFNCPIYAPRLSKELIIRGNCSEMFNVHNFKVDINKLIFFKNDVLKIQNNLINIIKTPGHTKDSVCYKWKKYIFTGDTIFFDSIGRWDLPSGNKIEIFKSIKKIANLFNNNDVILPGHGITYKEFSELKKFNPYLKHFLS